MRIEMENWINCKKKRKEKKKTKKEERKARKKKKTCFEICHFNLLNPAQLCNTGVIPTLYKLFNFQLI